MARALHEESKMKTILSALLLFASCHAFAFDEAAESGWAPEEQAYLNEADLNEGLDLRDQYQYRDDLPVVLVQGSSNMNPKFNIYNSKGGVPLSAQGYTPCGRGQFSFTEVKGWTRVEKGWRNPQYDFRKPRDVWMCKRR